MLDELLTRPQFSIPQEEKEALLLPRLGELVEHHRDACAGYRRILDALPDGPGRGLSDLPYLPVSMFKSHLLQSIPDDEVFKVMTSSGTTGQAVSRVVLDRTTADLQARALAAVMTTVLGPRRLPMLIVDTPNVVRDRRTFSARGAGVLGMLSFGRHHTYVLDDDMAIDVGALERFAERFSGQPVLVFGFTFMVWKYFHQQIQRRGLDVDLSGAVLIHSGGWKKLQDEAVGNAEFRAGLERSTGLRRIHNFYGMVEQVGGVFLEGPDGYLHPPNFSDVIIRDPVTWAEAPDGQVGVIEVLSTLPRSYPGHVLLTEDLGVVHGAGSPVTGWAGKKLEVIGRIPRAELRGCSDTHAYASAS
ncbi:LuxE/PaaK family acyltransferase [Pseudonocardia sp. TRM90224]|uniref:LuxE/PaaK family acyltransferase n=1 Tax=Pseudonocardia sp. TRM90224 TaxID=2812678 RepID=UPI001E4DA354|nr:acyl-protein synthetase [Pseudonocardia sp. TRM90224]